MENEFIFACKLHQIAPGKTKKICLPGRPPILLANVNQEIYAVDDTCTHEDSSLSLGCLREDKVKCTLHGSWFSVITGKPTEEPADEPLDTYPVKIMQEEVWVSVTPNKKS